MRRLLITAAALLLLGFASFVAFFSASGYRSARESYLRSFSDFVFMVGSYNSQFLGLEPPGVSRRRFERVLSHARYRAKPEVRHRVVWTLERWGEEVVPWLLVELERPQSPERMAVAVRTLARIGHPLSPELLERSLALEMRPMEKERLVEAMAELGPDVAPVLVAYYEHLRSSGGRSFFDLPDAIGKTGGGVAFLLEEMRRAREREDVDRIYGLLWPLASTRDVTAAKVLVELLHHPKYDVRRRARDAMAQSMGSAAVEPAADLLATESDDYVRSWILQSILASRHARGSPRVVELVGSLLDDPVLTWEANYALARIGSEEAIETLRRYTRGREPRWVMSNLEYSGEAGYPILVEYLGDEDRWVRRAALEKVLELESKSSLPLLQRASTDEDPRIRALARTELFRLDLLILAESFSAWLARITSAPAVPAWRLPSGTDIGAGVVLLSLFDWVGLTLSLAVGLAMLCGWLRAFEPYKFALAIQFLLVAGIVGDFFFIRQPGLYPWATAVRLLLLLGLLFLRDDPLPGETRGRIERLTLRSLWVLVPLLLFFGAPPFAAALRLALRDFEFTKWALLLLLLLTLLLVEQAALPWQLWSRGGRLERGLSLLLTAAAVALFVGALWWAPEETLQGSEDRRLLATLLTLPLAVSLLFCVVESGLFTSRQPRPSTPPAPGRLRTFFDGDSLIVRVRRRRRWRGLPQLLFGGGFLAATWWLSHYVSGAPGLVVLLVFSLFGTAMVSVLVLGLVPNYTIQVRAGAVRAGLTLLGGTLGRAPWHRRIRLPALLEASRLGTLERRWLQRLLDREPEERPQVELLLRGAEAGTIELEVRNLGPSPVRISDLEGRAGAPFRAEVAGRPADVYFSRADRERAISPGTRARFRPRVFGDGKGSGSMVLRCGELEAREEAA